MGASAWLYVPALVFGHAFCLFWLLGTLLVHLKRRHVLLTPPRVPAAGDAQQRHADSSGPESNRTPMTLIFRQVSCGFQDAAGQEVPALRGVSGVARPGEVLAVLGPSGAGKSTLMDVLALRHVSGKVSGSILVNHTPITLDFVQHRAYVPQEDAFPPVLTAHEVVRFHAALCTHGSQAGRGTSSQHAAANRRAEAALGAMGLTQQKNTLVGGTLSTGIRFRGLSGGQKRRLNIAAHLVGDPSVLFLDEPTSGLDASSALKVLSHLRVVARSGRTVMLTIHQPRAAIWELLDQVMVMAHGRLLFLGPPDSVVAWFTQSLGCTYEPAHHGIPSDWLMDLVSPLDSGAAVHCVDVEVSAASRRLCSSEAVAAAAQLFNKHFEQQQDDAQLQGQCECAATTAKPGHGAYVQVLAVASSNANHCPTADAGRSSSGVQVWLSHLRTLLARECLLVVRNPADAAGRMLACMYSALVIGMVYLNVATSAGSNAQARTGCMFAVLLCVAEVPFASMSLFMADKQLVLHEASEDLYPASAYYVARSLVATAFGVLNASVVAFIVYGLVGFRLDPVSALGWNLIFTVMVHLIFVQMLHGCATLAPSQDTAFMLAIVFLTFSLMLSNFFVRWQDMQWAFPVALRFASPLYYAFGSMVRAEFHHASDICKSDPAGQAACTAYNDGVDAHYTNYAFGISTAAMCAMLLGLHAFSYASLVWQVQRQRSSHHK